MSGCLHVQPGSVLQSFEQPSPLPALPSSHSSLSTMPSPHWEVQPWPLVHDGSFWQSIEQPSKGRLLPSSQPSAPSTFLSPHTVDVHLLGAPEHFQPSSSLHVAEQPSPLSLLPSSHSSVLDLT